MYESTFAARPAGLVEPPALRRAKVQAIPGGNAALAVRRRVLDARFKRTVASYAKSPDGLRSLELLKQLRDSQRGQTGVVLCNGPSINKTDLSLIGDHPYILMNRGYLLSDRLPNKPTALCVSADLVLEQYGAEISALESPLLLAAHHRDITERRENAAFVLPHPSWLFATRIGASLHLGYTVTFWALQMAHHLGWDRCLIVGMDHRYDRTGDPTVAVTTQGQDANHFDPNYFEHGSKWLLPALEMNEYGYKLARFAYESGGRRVVDCTVDGACTVFERSTLESELGQA